MKRLRFTLRGFRPPREAVRIAFGELERKVMEELWRRSTASVQEVYQAFGEQSAYTTLMTTLNRLHRKGLLYRRKKSRAFIYSPRVTREEFDWVVAKDVIGELLGNDAGQGLKHIVDAVSERDLDLLEELDRIVREKRRKLQKRG